MTNKNPHFNASTSYKPQHVSISQTIARKMVFTADFPHANLSRASQTNREMYSEQKRCGGSQSQYQNDYDCQRHVYLNPLPLNRREYLHEFPPQKEYCPYRGNFESCLCDVDVTRPCRSSTLWREKVGRDHSPISSVTDPFAVSLRRYSSERRQHGGSAHLLRKLLVYAKTSSKSYATRSLRVPIKKCKSVHKDNQLINSQPHKTRDEALQSMYRTKSCKNVERAASRRPSPTDHRNRTRNATQEARIHRATVGAETGRPNPDWSTTYDYLRKSPRSIYLPQGVLDRTTEVHYLDDVTRCVKHAIRMLIDSEKTAESCPSIASRYMQHVMEYHHKDAQAQVNFQQDSLEPKLSNETWRASITSDFGGSPLRITPSPIHHEATKPPIESPYGSGHRVCYLPNINDNDRILSDNTIVEIVQEWMRGIPVSAKFTAADKMQRERIVVELTNCLSSLLTEPEVAKTVVFKYLSDLPMWLPEGEAQIKYKNQIADNLISRLTEAGRVVVEMKNETFRWVKEIEYEPRDEDGEIVTDCKIVNNMAERLEPLIIINRPESERIHKSKLRSEIFEELLNIPIRVQGDMICDVKINLADDLASRLVCLNAAFKTNILKTRSDSKSENETIRNFIYDWMENIPVNPHFSQLDTELQEQWIDDLADKLTKLKADRNFETTGKDAIIKFLNNILMWWPVDDAKDVLIEELADKLMDKLADSNSFMNIKNIISKWAKNICTNNDITLKVFDKLQPLISDSKQLGKDKYKCKLKTVICDELKIIPVDFRGKNKSIAINELAEELAEKFIALDETKGGKETDSKIHPGRYLISIVKEWMKGIPYNPELSQEDSNRTIEDLALKLSALENDLLYKAKAKAAIISHLNDLPVLNPDDKDMVEFINENANELVKKLERANSLINNLKNSVSKWVINADYKTTDDHGLIVTDDVITNHIVESLQYTVLNRPKDDEDYRFKLERNILDVLKNSPVEQVLVSGLASDLANKLVNMDLVQSEAEKEKRRDFKTGGIQNIVNNWMKTLPVNHDFDSKEKQVRDQMVQQLVKQIALIRNDSNEESYFKEAALQFLRGIPIQTPDNHEKDKFMIDMSNNLYDKIIKFHETEDKLKRVISEWAACVHNRLLDDNGKQFTKADIIESVIKGIQHIVLNRPQSDYDYKDKLNDAISEELLKFPLDVNSKYKNRVIRELSKGLTEKLVSFQIDGLPFRKSVSKVGLSVINDTVYNFKLESTNNAVGQQIEISEKHESGLKQKSYAHKADRTKSSDTESRKRRKSSGSDSCESSDSCIDKHMSHKSDADGKKSSDSKRRKMRKKSPSDASPKKKCDLNIVDRKSRENHTGIRSSKSSVSDSDSKKNSDSRRDKHKTRDGDMDNKKSRDLKSEKRRKSSANDSSIGNRVLPESKERSTVSRIEKLSAGTKKRTSLSDEKSGNSKNKTKHESTQIDIDKKSRANDNTSEKKCVDSIGIQRKSRSKDKINRKKHDRKLNYSKSSEGSISDPPSTDNIPSNFVLSLENEIKSNKLFKPYTASSAPMVDEEIEKKVLEVLKDNFMFARLSPQEGINVIRGITEKLNELTPSASVQFKNFIDDAVSEWIEVLEEKAMERQFREEIFNCFKICPQTSEAVHKKTNQVLIYKLAHRLAVYELKGVHDKVHEEKNKTEIKNIVENIFRNENIDIKQIYQSADKIHEAIINFIKHTGKRKGNLKETFQNEIIQWLKSIPEISNTACKPEYKRATKKFAYELQMLEATETIDSVFMNRMQEKIKLFFETVLQNENVVIERRMKKRHIATLLNNILDVLKILKKSTESVNKLKSEITHWLFEIPLFRNASCSDRSGNVKNLAQVLFGLHGNRVDYRQHLVQDLVTEFIKHKIEKSHGSISAETKSILANELLERLTVKEYNTEYEKNKNKQSKNNSRVSFNTDAVKSLLEEVIKNQFYLKSDFNKGGSENYEEDETLYNDMTNKFAEILEKKFLLVYGSKKDKIKEDIPEYIWSLLRKRGSSVDYSVVRDITSKLMADVNVNLKTKQNKTQRKIPSDTLRTQIKIQQDNEDADLLTRYDSKEEKHNDYNVSHTQKGWNNDELTFDEETSDEKTSIKQKTYKKRVLLKNGHIEIQRHCKTLLNDNYQNGEKESTEKENEQSKKSPSPKRSPTDQDCNREYKSASNEPTTSRRCNINENRKGSKQGHQNFSHPPSTSQSSEDLTRNTYSLRKHIIKSNSPVRRDPSSPEISDNSSIDEENIMSLIKRHIIYPSITKEPDLSNLVDVRNTACNSRTKPRHETDIYHARIKEMNRQHLLQNENDSQRNKVRERKKENGPHCITTITEKYAENHFTPTKSSSVKKSITEILMRRVGLNHREASEFADVLIEKTRRLYEKEHVTTTTASEAMINTLRDEIQDVLKSFDIDNILEETELSILNLLTNQLKHGKVDDTSLRTSLMNILLEVNENIAEDVADTLLNHVKNISFEPKPTKKQAKVQEKCDTGQQYFTAVSLTSDDKQTYVDVLKKDIKEFVVERIPSRTSTSSEIVDKATDEFLKIFKDTMENSALTIEEQQSVIRRETERFLSTVPIQTNESKDDLVDKIVGILRHGYTISRDPSFSMTQSQKEAFLSDTKKLLSEICEDNDIDIAQAKQLALNLADNLNDMIVNKSLTDLEKWEQMKKEFHQYFRSLLPQSGSLPDDLASQVIHKIPNILYNSMAQTNLPSQKELIEMIMDFIKEKTGDMTPRSQQQLQAQIEEVIAETISILDDSNVTVSEKANMIKYGFARFLSEIPRQSNSVSIDELASELYDRLFRSRTTTKNSTTLSISSDEELTKIIDNEKRYLSQLMNIIRNWTDQASLITDEISDPNLKDVMTGDLAKDIIDRQKYIQLNPGAKTSDEDELEYLKYQVFRWLNRTLDVNDLGPFVSNIEDLMNQIRRVPVCALVKPSNKMLEDEIMKWVAQVPYNKTASKQHMKQIRDLANKIQRHRGKSRVDSKIDGDISQFVPNMFNEDDSTLKALGIQLKTYLKNQGLLRDLNARAYKTGAEDLYELVEDWCRDLPIYLGDSREEKERVKTMKQNIASKLINKLGELNMNPQILNDDFLYEDLLLDEVDNLLCRVPRNPELEKYLPALKRDLLSRVKGARQKIRDEQAAHVYRQQLRDTIATATSIPEPLFPDEIIFFEILRDNLVDAFINLHYVTDNDQEELKFKRKISDAIGRFCNDYLRRHPCTPIDPNSLGRQLYRALQAVPIPTDDSLRSEIEQIKIKEILLEWARELPLKDETGSELLQRNKTLAVLAKRIREIEKEKYSNICFDSEGKLRDEISKWLRRNTFKVGHDSEIPRAVDRIVEKLKQTQHARALEASKSWVDNCFCIPNKPVIPPCTLSAEDKAHLKRIREKYNTACVKKSSLSIENSCQTIEPQPWCPNRTIQDRIPACSSNQPPFPCPMNTSASPNDMHQCPHVIVKDHLWDSTDSKMSGMQTSQLPYRPAPPCIQKKLSTDNRFPKCTSVSSQIGPAIEPTICPRSSAFKCSQATQARQNAAVACSTPKIFDSPDSEEDRCCEDYNILPCRPRATRICEDSFQTCRPGGALYSSFLPRKDKTKSRKKRPVQEFESFRPSYEECCKNSASYRPSYELCDNERRRKQAPCVCKGGRSVNKGYHASRITEEETSSHNNSGADCPYPSYMYFRD